MSAISDECAARSTPENKNVALHEKVDEECGDKVHLLSKQDDVPKFVKFAVRYPLRIFLFILSFCLFTCIALARSAIKNGNPFTSNDTSYDLNDIRSIHYDALRLAREDVASSFLENSPFYDDDDDTQKRLQEDVGDVTYWIFEAKTEKGVFTNITLPLMRSTELMLTRHKQYPNYCRLVYTSENGNNQTESSCQKSMSVVNIFYASRWNSTAAQRVISELATNDRVMLYNTLAACTEYDMLCQYLPASITVHDKQWAQSIHNDIVEIMKYWDGEGTLNQDIEEVSMFLATMNNLHTKAPYVNFFFDSNFTTTNPIAMYSRLIVFWGSPLTGANDTAPHLKETSRDLLKRFIIKTFLSDLKRISDPRQNDQMRTYYFMGTLIFDIIIDILLSDAVKAILSFVSVFLYLRYMIGSWFLAIVGMLEIFMSLPVAWYFFSYILNIRYFSTLNVLCIFIVAAIGADDIFVFMDAYHQSAHKNKYILQSLEHRMAWVYRRSGKAMAITSATTCFAFLCTLVSPIAGTRSFGIFASLVILFDYIFVMSMFCTAVIIYHDRFENENGCCSCFCCSKNDPSPTEVASSLIQIKQDKKIDQMGLFFKEKVSQFVLNPVNRVRVAIPFVIWITLTTIYTAKLAPTTTVEQALDKNHPLQKGATILSENFPKVQRDRGSKIHFVWGLESVDRTDVNQLFDPDFTGTPVYDENFSFNPICQQKMLQACDAIKIDERFEHYIKRRDGLRSVRCFVEELGAYNSMNSSTACAQANNGSWKNTDWYIETDDLKSVMEHFVYQESCVSSSKVIETYDATLGWDGNDLKFAGISIESSILDPFSTLSEDVVRDHYDIFSMLKGELDASMSGDCQSEVIFSDLDQKFIFMNNQKIYRTSAVGGSLLGVLIAFVVLLISTRNIIISLFATISILSVLVTVIGIVSMLGWTLGTNEAILMSILAGFSVDYVVHLAHAYVESEGLDSVDRIKGAFGDMGTSVFSGMLTSVIASIPLFFCTLIFFEKFGLFLCLTILFSWFFANFLFMSLVAQFKVSINKKSKLSRVGLSHE